MGKLSHDNVVQAVNLPLELRPGPGEAPILGMEYCEGGDLRKVNFLIVKTFSFHV